jgi:hypothetical protein
MGTTGQDLALKPLKAGPGRGLTGQTMVSALIAIGISTIGLLVTTTLIQQSLKAGRSAEGLAASGLLTDTVRTVLAAKSGADCPRVFVPSSGTLTFPSAGSTVTLSRLEIPPPAGSPAGTAGTPLIAVNGKFSPTVKVTGLQLARRTDGFLELRISAEKTEGVKRLEVPTLLLAPTFDATTGALTACGYAAAGAGAGSGPTCTVRSEANTVRCNPDEIMTGASCLGQDLCRGNDSSSYGGSLLDDGPPDRIPRGIQCSGHGCTVHTAYAVCCKR